MTTTNNRKQSHTTTYPQTPSTSAGITATDNYKQQGTPPANTATTDNYKQQAPTTVTTTSNRKQSHTTTYPPWQHKPQRRPPNQTWNSSDNQQTTCMRRATSAQQHSSNQRAKPGMQCATQPATNNIQAASHISVAPFKSSRSLDTSCGSFVACTHLKCSPTRSQFETCAKHLGSLAAATGPTTMRCWWLG